MELKHTVVTSDAKAVWIRELREILGGFGVGQFEVKETSDDLSQLSTHLVFVDGHTGNLDHLLNSMNRKGKAVFVVVRENFDPKAQIPQAVLDGVVQDVLVYPFRPIEVLGKIRAYQQILAWEEVEALNSNFSQILSRLHDDLILAERLQTARRKTRFPNIKGLQVHSRYLAGMKSGGDFFDLAESQSKLGPVSIVLSDSSSYGLSSVVLSVLVRVVMKLAAEDALSCSEAVRRVAEEIQVTLGDRDHLSLFYGVLSRKDLKMRYLNFGSSRAFHAPEGSEFRLLPGKSKPISKEAASTLQDSLHEYELVLSPRDRFVLVSDGFIETCGGEQACFRVLNQFRNEPQAKLLNELAFLTKGTLPDDEMPAHDSTAVVVDVDSNTLRLA